ncbi:MFS transporter [Clostridium sp. 'deep sea']|uniref:MFS transporter n=1 Tax=Clostridium sp. 'deep sea' TaxID=2779445 RepID=UPI001896437D|nr:MFS transporter [Clostridium sp. 'deep sea']QOR36529.1 MFS transporter [Clostridium sp. 'deep sea']
MNKKKLFNKNFVLLWLGQTVSQIGNTAGSIALIWWITTERSVEALGIMAMVSGLVAVIAGSFAGALVDKLNKKYIIVICDLLQFIIYAILGYCALKAKLTLPVLYTCSGFSTLVTVMFGPAISASVPLIVDKEDLVKANSLTKSSESSVKIIGFVVGGIGLSLFGVPMFLVLDSITYLISAISEMFILIPYKVKNKVKIKFKAIVCDIKLGYNYVKTDKGLFTIMIFAMLVNVLFIPIFLLLPMYVKYTLGFDSNVYGFFSAAMLTGFLLGSLILSTVDVAKKFPQLLKWCMLIIGLCLLPLSLLPQHLWYLNLITFVICGLVNSIFNISLMTSIQKTTKQEHMGKVFGFMNTVSMGLQPAAQGLTGYIAKFVAITTIYLVCSVSIIISGIQFAFNKLMVARVTGHNTETQPAIAD